jgi:rhodanese-related sulfurtransferase
MPAVRSVSVAELKALVEQGAQVVDVREPWEYAEGHVPGARLVPLAEVPTLVGQLPEGEPVYLVCAVGARSGRAAQFLAQHGVEAVNVLGGTGEWAAAGYPLER